MINRQRIRALIRKDWRELARNKQAVAPLVIIPLLFAVIIPTAIIVLGNNAVLASSITGLRGFLDNLPDRVIPAGFSTAQTVVYAVIVYFMAPFFLVIPVMVASITASSSFVGEKERRTIEGLLYTPITDRELVLAKVLVSVLPSVLLTWASFLIYTVLVNALGASLMGGLFFPTWTWAIIILAMVPLVAFLATLPHRGHLRAFHDDARRSKLSSADHVSGHCPRRRSGDRITAVRYHHRDPRVSNTPGDRCRGVHGGRRSLPAGNASSPAYRRLE